MVVFNATFRGDESFTATFQSGQTFGTTFQTVVEVQGDVFTGSYEVTPSAETQILETAHLNMAENLVINPIPNNYGLITWDGSTITVS